MISFPGGPHDVEIDGQEKTGQMAQDPAPGKKQKRQALRT